MLSCVGSRKEAISVHQISSLTAESNICITPEAPSRPGLMLECMWKVTTDKQSWEISARILLASENSVQVGQT